MIARISEIIKIFFRMDQQVLKQKMNFCGSNSKIFQPPLFFFFFATTLLNYPIITEVRFSLQTKLQQFFFTSFDVQLAVDIFAYKLFNKNLVQITQRWQRAEPLIASQFIIDIRQIINDFYDKWYQYQTQVINVTNNCS